MKLSPISIAFLSSTNAFTPNANAKFASSQLRASAKVTDEMRERFEKLGLPKPRTVRHRAICISPESSGPVDAEVATSQEKIIGIDNTFLAQCVAQLEMIESVEEFDFTIKASKALGGNISKDFKSKADTICKSSPKPIPRVAVAMR